MNKLIFIFSFLIIFYNPNLAGTSEKSVLNITEDDFVIGDFNGRVKLYVNTGSQYSSNFVFDNRKLHKI